ncbi:TPA: IS1595 family transposase [Neisseria meningitidis]
MRKSRLSRYKQNKLIELFVAGVTARTATEPDSIVYTDCYRSYDVLDVSEFSHFRINHSTHFAERQNHINGIENFWNQAKRHLRKFNGIPKAHFELYLKECEWRFNNSEIKVLVPF